METIDKSKIFEASPEDLLKSQIAYHKERINHHKTKVAEIEAMLSRIYSIKSTNGVDLYTSIGKPIDLNGDAVKISSISKNKVEQVMRDEGKPMKTEDILAKIYPELLSGESRDKAINKVSQQLMLLKKENTVKSEKSGERGLKYEIIF